MLKLTQEQAAAAVRSVEGPRLSIPVAIVRRLGDLAASAFLSQAAYLSSLKGDADYWFSLPQLGEAQANQDAEQASLWAKLGSWEAILGLGQDAQVAARRRIDAAAPGLLETRKRGIPAHLEYRVSPSAYLQFLIDVGLQSPGSPDSRIRENRTLESADSGSKRRARAEAIPKSIPKSPTKESARAPARGKSGFVLDPRTGLHHKPGDEADAAAMAAILQYPVVAIEEARLAAAARDDRGRAFPGPVLRILLRSTAGPQRSEPQAPAWATAAERYHYQRPAGGDVIDL